MFNYILHKKTMKLFLEKLKEMHGISLTIHESSILNKSI